MSHLDRTGDEIDPDADPGPPEHDPRCDGQGWLGDSRDTDNPIPCPTCRPKAAQAVARRRAHGTSDPGPSNRDGDSGRPVAPSGDQQAHPRGNGWSTPLEDA